MPVHAHAIARVSGNGMWSFGKCFTKTLRENKHSFHNKHVYIIQVTDILKFYGVLFCTYRKVLTLENCCYAYIPPYMYKTLPTLRNEKEQ